MKCTNCNKKASEFNIEIVGNEIMLCEKCRDDMLSKLKRPIGRKRIGITKKVSITLEEEMWKVIEDKSNGNKSSFFRELINEKYYK